jgi:hypothetical protein
MVVLAIFHFIVAGFGVCCVSLNLVSTAAPMGPGGGGGGGNAQQEKIVKELQEILKHAPPAYEGWSLAQLGIWAVLAVLLIVGGIGLINMRPWGRTASLLYALISLASKIAALVIHFTVLMPALQPFIEQAQAADPELGRFLNLGFLFLGLLPLVMCIYPVIVLIIMLLPSTARAFRREEAGPVETDRGEPGGFDDDRWGR